MFRWLDRLLTRSVPERRAPRSKTAAQLTRERADKAKRDAFDLAVELEGQRARRGA